jgi:SAM-dependent methyltransferase
MQEYDDIAAHYVAVRRTSIGVSDVAAFVRPLPPGSRVLDLGCGDGIPISRLLHDSGLDVFGIDSSARMVERFRANCPGVPVQHAPILESNFFNLTFDAVVAWGILFHLSPTDQEAAIAKVSACLNPRGRFLFTSGDEEGTIESSMHGVTFHYVSLGSARYAAVLRANGLRLVDEHRDLWGNYYYVAERGESDARPG